jgi:hypothetical protein
MSREATCIYIVFFLQYQKVQNNCQILLKRAEANVIPIIFNSFLPFPYMLQYKEALHFPYTIHSFACCSNDKLCIWFPVTKNYQIPFLNGLHPVIEIIDSISIAQERTQLPYIVRNVSFFQNWEAITSLYIMYLNEYIYLFQRRHINNQIHLLI